MVLTLIPAMSTKNDKYTETYGLLLEQLNFKIRKTSTAPKQSNVLTFGALLEGSASRLLQAFIMQDASSLAFSRHGPRLPLLDTGTLILSAKTIPSTPGCRGGEGKSRNDLAGESRRRGSTRLPQLNPSSRNSCRGENEGSWEETRWSRESLTVIGVDESRRCSVCLLASGVAVRRQHRGPALRSHRPHRARP